MSYADQISHLADHGFCTIPGVLTRSECAHVRERLLAAAKESERRGASTFIPQLDPNAQNVRVFNLLDLDPVFVELIRHPLAYQLVESVLGEGFMISNFTANIARPGSRSMALHSDQALVVPEPWLAPWSMNVIWCLDDVHEANGATRYLPGSHRFTGLDQLPEDALTRMRPFEAEAGSIIAMEGRMWHTSGANTTRDEERALLFGYYAMDFLRPQVNWNVVLSDATRASLDPALSDRLGLGPAANTRVGSALTSRMQRLG